MSAAALISLIVYNFLYYFLYLVLFAFLVVTPIDLIQQDVQRGRRYDILVIAISYVATILVVAFIYATRLYINRSVLASIPRSWIPVEKGDVPHDVRQMIVDGLSRSAAIAYDARPRMPLVLPVQQSAPDGGGGEGGQPSAGSGVPPWLANSRKSAVSGGEGIAIEITPRKPVWGEIEHPGWSSPTSPDHPNLQYETVVQELPHLIEAKALTLAPPDPESHAEPPTLDPDAVVLLQRPESMGLREYLMHLTDLAVLAPLPTTAEFLAKYEAARFGARPLTNEQFRNLMHLFAEILRNMHPLSPVAIARYVGDDGSSGEMGTFESDIDDDAPRGTRTPSSAGTALGLGLNSSNGNGDYGGLPRRGSSSTASGSSSGLVRRRRGLSARHSSSIHTQFRTAPTTPRSRRTGFSRASSSDSFAQTRRPYAAGQTSSSSSSSSMRSAGAGSVIRLAGAGDDTELPYVLTYSPSPG